MQATGAGGSIDQGNPAHFDIVFRRDNHFGFGVDFVVNAVKNGPVQIEINRIAGNLAADRMRGHGPEPIHILLMDVAKSAHCITGRI